MTSGANFIDDPRKWRVSKSGFSIRTGWNEDKTIIARYPGASSPLDNEHFQKWLDAAFAICELYNSLLAAAAPAQALTDLQRAVIDHDDDMARLDRNTLAHTAKLGHAQNPAAFCLECNEHPCRLIAPASPAAIRDEALTLTDLQEAYNQGIEDAKCAIRAESQGGGYWAATYINAIARRCSPFRYTGLPADANDDDRERMINEAGLVDEVQHRMDQVVEAAVEWHQAGQEGGEWIEYADKLGAAINSLLELRDAPSKAATEYGAGAIVDRLVRISVEENADPSIRAKEAAEEILKRINAALTTTVPSEFIEAFGEGASVTIGQGAIPKIAAIIERVCFSTGNGEDQAMT